MKKKYLSAALAIILAAGMLAGCSGESTPATSSSTSSASSADAGSKAEDTDTPAAEGTKKFDDVKLKMLICWNGGFKTASDQYGNPVASAIREKTGVTIEFEQIMMSETEKLNLVFASGDMPDMINAPYWGGDGGETQVIKKAATEGRLIDIKEKLPNYPNIACAYDIGVISQAYLENDLDAPQFNGARYILPQEVPGDVADVTNWAYGVFVRGDVPKALGIDEKSIKTTDQLWDFMTKARDHGFKDVNGNPTIVATTYHEAWGRDDYLTNFRPKALTDYRLDADGNVTHRFLTDEWMNENIFNWKMVQQGILDKECFKHNDDQAKEKTGNGTALFATAQYGVTLDATKLTGLYNSNPEMRYIPVGPLNYADGSALKSTESEGRTGSPAIIFPTTCTDIDAALTYLDYVNSKEGVQLMKYGLVGDTCVLNDQGQPRLREDLLKRKLEQDPTIDQDLREFGVNYMQGRLMTAEKSVTWFGEKDVGSADAELPEMTAYKEARPVEVLKGYRIDKIAPGYKDYETVKAFAFEGTKERDYRERAYFAETEDQARAILKEYQDYLLTQESGMFKDFLSYLTEQMKSRGDVVL